MHPFIPPSLVEPEPAAWQAADDRQVGVALTLLKRTSASSHLIQTVRQLIQPPIARKG
jgi:hypothetical protein